MAKTILILHGWGLSGSKYKELQRILEQKKYSVFSPDLPGFGNEPLTKDSMNVQDYAEFIAQDIVAKYLKENKLSKMYIIGHSFGGRVAAKLAVLRPELIEKLVITGSPLIQTKLSLKKQIVQLAVRVGKKFTYIIPSKLQDLIRKGIYRLIGEFDYYKANKLKRTFQKVINENAEVYLLRIQCPTLLLWGKNDSFVSPKIGKQIADAIPGAQFEVIPNEGHGIPYTTPKLFAEKVVKFFES